MTRAPLKGYRPDLATLGYALTCGKGKECKLTTARRPVALNSNTLKSHGGSLYADQARWALWHKGIDNAPDVPDLDTIARQTKHLAPNMLTRNEYVDVFTDALLDELTALIAEAA